MQTGHTSFNMEMTEGKEFGAMQARVTTVKKTGVVVAAEVQTRSAETLQETVLVNAQEMAHRETAGMGNN
jgi:predicted enzyme involved in methoxymalonyl-ACP biosynthesis